MMESVIRLDWVVESDDKEVEDDIREQLGDKVTDIKLIDAKYSEYEITYADTPKNLLQKLVDIDYFDDDEINDYLSDIVYIH